METGPLSLSMPRPVFFRSGCSSRADFLAAVRADVPAGISLSDASAPVLREVEIHLERGGRVFVDSGAFGAFRKGRRLGPGDFARILEVYGRLALAARPGNLFVVAPDVVGDQVATLELVREYAATLRGVAATGAQVLVPLQKGDRPVAAFYHDVRRALAGMPFTPALPSNAAALTPDEAKEFLLEAKPRYVHFLGAARSFRFRELLAESREMLPSAQFSYDAAVVRSVSRQIIRTDEGVHEMAGEMLDCGEVDEGELAEALRGGVPDALGVLADMLARPGRTSADILAELCNARERADGDTMAALEEVEPGLDALWPYFAMRWARSEARRRWRTIALARVPAFAEDPADVAAPGYLFPCCAA